MNLVRLNFIKLGIILPLAIGCVLAQAGDLGFRFNGTACVNSTGTAGLNPGYIGQCGDLRHLTVSGLGFDGLDLSGAVMDGSNFTNSSFSGTNFTYASLVGANFSGVVMSNAILHNTNLSQANLIGTHFVGADIKTANFSQANLSGDLFSTMSLKGNSFNGANLASAALDGTDLSGIDFTSAIITNANLQSSKLDGATLNQADLSGSDLTGASLQSIQANQVHFTNSILRQGNFQGSSMIAASLRGAMMDNANLKGVNLTSGDLRRAVLTGAVLDGGTFTGATINKKTVLPITPAAAAQLGMVTQNGSNVMLLYDGGDGQIAQFVAGLQQLGLQVTFSPEPLASFRGDLNFSAYDALLNITGNNYSTDINPAGQTELVKFVQGGGTYITTGTDSYMASQNFLQQMLDLVLITITQISSGNLVVTPATGFTSHPIFVGVTGPMTLTAGLPYIQGTLKTFAANPAQVIATDQGNDPIIVTRDFGRGHVVQFALCSPNADGCLIDPGFQQLVFNAANW